MKTLTVKVQKTSVLLTGIISAAAAVGLIIYSDSVKTGVLNGLSLCAQSIIPSLFIFIILAVFMCRSPAGKLVSILFYPLTRFVLRLNPKLGCTVIMSMLGGYPVGAALLSDMVRKGEITKKTASRMMCFCSNAGPAFVITAVGVNMFGSFSVGVILLASHLMSSVIIGAFTGHFFKHDDFPKKGGKASELKREKAESLGDIFVESVSSGVNSILAICAYVVLFSAVLAVIGENGFIRQMIYFLSYKTGLEYELILGVLNGFLEVTTACKMLSDILSLNHVILASFFISFSGLSIILQVKHCFKDTGVSLSGYITSRFAAGVISAALTRIMLFVFPITLSVSSALDKPVMSSAAGSVVNSVILVVLCCVFLFSLNLRKDKKAV